jgi:rifampicin phosphotransferase
VTWDESDEELWSIVQEQVGAGPAESIGVSSEEDSVSAARALAAVVDRVTTTRKWRLTRILTGQVVDLRRRMLRRLVADAREFLRLREELKSAILRLGGEERRVVREVAAAVELDADDVWLTTDAELDAFALGAREPDRRVLRLRREAIEGMGELPALPDVFTGVPQAAPSEVHAGELRGRPASAGVATGRALLARSRTDAAKLQRGEILVGSSTDPSWTPLFGRAAAIVMERGGPLSHAAIVARELDVPAVLGVEGALSVIKPGATLRVDGSRGTVDVIDGEDGGES